MTNWCATHRADPKWANPCEARRPRPRRLLGSLDPADLVDVGTDCARDLGGRGQTSQAPAGSWRDAIDIVPPLNLPGVRRHGQDHRPRPRPHRKGNQSKNHNHSQRRRNHAKRNSQFSPQISAATGENRLQRGARMRQEQQPIAVALSAVDFKFRFQLTNAGEQHACSVTIQAVSIYDAAALFRANWPTIEYLARRSLPADDLSDLRLEATLADWSPVEGSSGDHRR